MDYLITLGTPPANFETIGHCSYPELCVVKKDEGYSGTGYEEGQYSFVLNNRAVLRHKTKLLTFVFSMDYNDKLNDPIVRGLVVNGSRIRTYVM